MRLGDSIRIPHLAQNLKPLQTFQEEYISLILSAFMYVQEL
jgi:hypothetical protein